MAAQNSTPLQIPYVEDFQKFFYPLDRLGAGAYSVVYRCFDRKTLQKVAVKIMTCDRYDRSKLELVLTEIAALLTLNEAGISHIPRLFNYFACGATDKTIKFVISMEYIDGTTLRQYYNKGLVTQDSYARICSWLFQILARIHEHDVVHRDIKPDNIVIKHLGNLDMYLIDFGFSCSVKSSQSITECSLGSKRGTLGYIAPEVLDGSYTNLEILKKSDVFSAAATLRFLVEPDGIDRNVDKIRVKHRPPISLVLEKCLNLDPAKRPTAAWAAQTLHNYFKF